MGAVELPDQVTVEIEVARGGWVKRRADGEVDYVSPLPCPFNYGSVPVLLGGDGDPLDAVVLGPGLRRGERVSVRVHAVVRFVDADQIDDKLICGPSAPTAGDRAMIEGFFRAYARAKRLLYAVRGPRGRRTQYVGWEDRP